MEEIMEESKRIKEQRSQELRDEALNPTPEAVETGRNNSDRARAVRNTSVYDEFDSKKAGPGGYGDRSDMPLTERKMRKDAEMREEDLNEEELKEAEREKRIKERRKKEREKDWGD